MRHLVVRLIVMSAAIALPIAAAGSVSPRTGDGESFAAASSPQRGWADPTPRSGPNLDATSVLHSETTTVPEPGTLVLMGLGIALVTLVRRRR
jgi:hypothetical protein